MPERGTFDQQSMLDPRNQNRNARPRDSNMKLDVLSVAALVLLASGTGPASAGESMAAGAMPAESPRDATYLVEAQPVSSSAAANAPSRAIVRVALNEL